MDLIKLVKGDITEVEVDAIVNAAHEGLSGGGGVDGAIHRAAGQKLLGECLNITDNPRCPTGEARITGGYNLRAKHVIHTVGPVYRQSSARKEEELLRNCYKNSLKLADENGLKSIAFPCISTGAYCFPKDKAAKIAVEEIRNFEGENLEEVQIVCFDDGNYFIYQDLL